MKDRISNILCSSYILLSPLFDDLLYEKNKQDRSGLMKVQEVILSSDEKRYLVLDDRQKVIQPVLLFMRYLDTVKKSQYTKDILLWVKRFLSLSIIN